MGPASGTVDPCIHPSGTGLSPGPVKDGRRSLFPTHDKYPHVIRQGIRAVSVVLCDFGLG